MCTMQECTSHSYAPSRAKRRAWYGLLAAAVLVTSGFAIPIGIGSLVDRQAKPRTAEVVKRCDRDGGSTGRARKASGTQAQSGKAPALLRWLL
jgi:hypothetical protein